MATDPPKRILISGATGKQGGAVIRALLSNPPDFQHEILALTRNPNSASAKKLAEKPRVRVLAGDLEDVDAIFTEAGGPESVWGVFSVQVPDMVKGKGSEEKEFRQGSALVDAAVKNGVKHFVYTSVDRGGDRSFNNPTDIPHFISKHQIEHHLVDSVAESDMTYTILRPVAFMDGLQPNFAGRSFAGMWSLMGDKKLQLVATSDIGIFAAQAFAFSTTDEYKNAAISLAGDELSQAEANEVFWSVLGRPQVKNELAGRILKWMIADLGLMFRWFEEVGYDVDIAKCKRLNSEMKDLATWLKQESAFRR